MRALILAILLIGSVSCIWPKPNNMQTGDGFVKFTRCSFEAQPNMPAHVQEKLDHYFGFVFGAHEGCEEGADVQNVFLSLEIADDELGPMRSTTSEYYELTVAENALAIRSETYVGFLRGLESLFQLIEQEPSGQAVRIRNTPILIQDQPFLSHRGVMIDTARHFLPKEAILRTLDAMMYNKLNVLHIHITDDESFPIWLESIPQLPLTASFSDEQRYMPDDVRALIAKANSNGIRVVPEVTRIILRERAYYSLKV